MLLYVASPDKAYFLEVEMEKLVLYYHMIFVPSFARRRIIFRSKLSGSPSRIHVVILLHLYVHPES
jgi:hypothetical protein